MLVLHENLPSHGQSLLQMDGFSANISESCLHNLHKKATGAAAVLGGCVSHHGCGGGGLWWLEEVENIAGVSASRDIKIEG